VFNAPFGRSFAPPLGPALSTANPWWLSGGIAAANCIAAYQPKGAANLAASYINLANPGAYNLTLGTAPTWDITNGWKFLASSYQYLKTNVIPSSTAMSVFIQFTNALSSGDVIGSQKSATGYPRSLQIIPFWSTNQVFYGNGKNYIFVTPNLTNGNLGLAGFIGYRNGVSDGTITTETTFANLELYIGALNLYGSPSSYFTGYVQALAIYNITLTTQISALTTAMAAL
jgi:hypothetical protein